MHTSNSNAELKIASIQMVSSTSVDDNLNTAALLIEQAAKQGNSIAVLPEYFCLLGNKDKDKLLIKEEFGSGKIQDHLAKLAFKNKIYIIAGTMPLTSHEPDRVWNSSLVFNPQGEIICRYDKIHLFAFCYGQENYDESRSLIPGNQPCTFKIEQNGEIWTFGLSICYDLRFPELYRSIGEVDAHIIPAAFTYTTGQAHWEILLRSRAIENQCYVIASAQGGVHENTRRTWGHSMIIDPWGEVKTHLPQGSGLIEASLSKEQLNHVRSKLPALKHRK